ncbi:MAG TPA: pyridoxal-phosphate dependent enzyme, partial [Gemmatimonadaceae bacterium]|nr:pyridoxal-phosphate dependent enzyme [Gemmatimonadaceae bacterium]
MTSTIATVWPITYDQVEQARERLAPHLTATPLRQYPLLDAATGLSLFVKHENHQPTGSFKVRNGLSFMTALTPAERARGVVAASTGNHGQGIAYGARLVGTTATICVPRG